MPQNYSDRIYTKQDAEKFIKLLGCWTFINPVDASKRRHPDDYRESLNWLIQANKTRKDCIGKWETAAAKRVLADLDKA